MISQRFLAVTAALMLATTLRAQAATQTATRAASDTTSGTMAGCPGGNGIHISATGGTLTDSSSSTSGVNKVIAIGQSVDTTLVFDIARKTWTRTNLAAAISVGLADESRGRYAVCAGVSALLPNVTLTLQGVRGRVHFVASLKDFNDALRLGPGR
jgi:hypothetical protein